jgi:hypothetical protein
MRHEVFYTLAMVLGLIIALVLLSIHPVQAEAEIYYVDDDAACPGLGTYEQPYCTIQDGIDAALPGDTAQVAPGTYYENIHMKSGVIIQGAGAGDDPTLHSIIDGGGAGVVVIASGVDSAAMIDGFMITNGSSLQAGGMANVHSSSPMVTNCIFSGNSSEGSGGGMYNSGSSPTVTNCSFSANSARRKGGGMYNISSSPTVTNCTFFGNSVTNPDARGGGMYNQDSSPTVTNSIFSGNAADFGGGMYNLGDGSPELTNCTFSGNLASDGGGMFNDNSSSPAVTNCILWGDSPQEIYNSGSVPAVAYSVIQLPDPSETYSGEGNINAEPLFVDPDGPDDVPGNLDDDLRLQSLSPCRDSGTPNGAPDTDIEGKQRPQGRAYDMGAYEFISPKAMSWLLLLLGD